MLIQVDFLSAMVRDDGECLGVELFHEVCGNTFWNVTVNHGGGEVLRELFLERFDIHDFHAAGEWCRKLCNELWLVFAGEVEFLQQVDADELAVGFHAERESAHVYDARFGAEAFAELHGDSCAEERAFEEPEHVVVRKEAAYASLLEGDLVTVTDLLAWAAVGDELLDFFGGAAYSLVAHGVVCEADFFAEAWDAALLTVAPFAVRYGFRVRVESLFPFAAEVLLRCACVDEVPREDFVLFAFAVDPVDVVAGFLPDLFPLGEVEAVTVAFEDDALLVGGVDYWREAPVATAIDGFEQTCFPAGPVDFHVRVLEELFAHVTDVAKRRFLVHEGRPLEACEGFRDEDADGDGDLDSAVVLATDFDQIKDEVAEGLHVLLVFRGEAYHRVELDFVESALEGMLGGVVHVLVADGLVNHLADAFGAGFWGERSAAATFQCGDFFGKALPETVHADGGEAHVHVVVERVVDDGIGEGFYWFVVGCGKAQKAEFALACCLESSLCNVQNVIRVEFAAGAVPDARLAEPATLGATAHHFDAKTVVHESHVRNQVLDGVVLRIHHGDELPAHAVRCGVGAGGGGRRHNRAEFAFDDFAHARYVNAVDFRQICENFGTLEVRLAPLAYALHEFENHLFAVANHEGVKKVRHRLRVRHRRAARDDNRVFFLAVLLPGRNPCKFQHVRDVREVQFRLERNAHDVEILDRRVTCVRVQGNIVLLHLAGHVVPRGKGHFAKHVRFAVHHMVKNAHAVVAHADFVGVREHERHAGEHLGMVFDDAVGFTTHVAGGVFNGGESKSDFLENSHAGKFSN